MFVLALVTPYIETSTRFMWHCSTKKVNAIANIAPKTKKELRAFIGMVNYYQDMWVRRSHVLAPLAALTSNLAKWRWGSEEQEAFDKMKEIIGQETMLAYPDFNKEFVIHTYALISGIPLPKGNC